MKTVSYPIRIPSNGYCWDHTGSKEICEHFNNEGYKRCELGFGPLNSVNSGVLKPKECLELKEV